MVLRRPKYLEIREHLAARIRTREFTAGQSLPSQATLSREYGVTLMTLRQALRSLQDEGLIVQLRGRGTFITPVPKLDLAFLRSLTDELAAQGISLITEVIASRLRPLPEDVATSLGHLMGEPALRLERLRRIGATPVVHQVSWVPGPWAEQLTDVDFTAQSLYGALAERCKVGVASATETLRARSLPRPTAKLAGARPGSPTLVTERVTFDTTGASVVFDVATLLDDTLTVVVQRAQRRTELTWAAAPSGSRGTAAPDRSSKSDVDVQPVPGPLSG